MGPLYLVLSCGGPDTSGVVSTTAETGEPGPPVEVEVWPSAPWPDSPLRPVVEEGEPASCRWSVDGVVVHETCDVLGETLGLVPGAEVSVAVSLGDREGVSAVVRVSDWPTLLVTELAGGTVKAFSGETGRLVATVALDGDAPSPIAVVVTEDGEVWVTDQGGQAVVQIDPQTWTVVGSVAVGQPVHWIDYDAVRKRLLVTDQHNPRRLLLGDDTESRVLPEPPVSVVVRNTRAWVAGPGFADPGTHYDSGWGGDGFLGRVDLYLEKVDWVPIEGFPLWAAPSPDGAVVAIGDRSEGNIVMVDAGSLEIRDVIPSSGSPACLTWSLDSRLLWTTTPDGHLSVIKANSGWRLRYWDLEGELMGVFPRADGRWLYLPLADKGSVVVVDTARYDEAGYEPYTIAGLSGPRHVAILP